MSLETMEYYVVVLTCTLGLYREQRLKRASENLKMMRIFTTLVEEMKVMRQVDESRCTEVMAPVALSDRSPVLLLMGGGMGAGKSTVLKDILKEYDPINVSLVIVVSSPTQNS